MRKQVKVICKSCGKGFVKNVHNQICCSRDCWLKKHSGSLNDKLSRKRYKQSLKGKAADQRYFRSIKRKITSKKWNTQNLDKLRESYKKYESNNPQKRKAKALARKIKIPEEQICEMCKKNLATEKHHEDYSKPLEVIFCCRNYCHAILDKERKKRELKLRLKTI